MADVTIIPNPIVVSPAPPVIPPVTSAVQSAATLPAQNIPSANITGSSSINILSSTSSNPQNNSTSTAGNSSSPTTSVSPTSSTNADLSATTADNSQNDGLQASGQQDIRQQKILSDASQPHQEMKTLAPPSLMADLDQTLGNFDPWIWPSIILLIVLAAALLFIRRKPSDL